MIVWLASYPRSGNTFFRILLKQIYGIKTYSIYNDPLFDKLDVSDIVGHNNLHLTFPEMKASEQIFFVKTHHLPSDNSPAIYLVRDGRDSLVSYAHFILSFRHNLRQDSWRVKIKRLLGWNEYSEILKKLIISPEQDYGSWSQNVNQWMHREAFTFSVKFEDLLNNPFEQITKAVTTLKLPRNISPQNNSIPSFEELHTKSPNFFRKGRSKSWQQEMSPPLENLFWKYHGDAMHKLGYSL
jgi:hypothetical protein